VTTELGKAKQARRSLEKVRQNLLTPTIKTLNSSTIDLAEAIDCMKQLEKECLSNQGRPPGLRRALEHEMIVLRQELQAVKALAAGAGKFIEGWARLIRPPVDDAPANYTNRGTPGVVVPIDSPCSSKRLVIHG
jgi:hypothetical protein